MFGGIPPAFGGMYSMFGGVSPAFRGMYPVFEGVPPVFEGMYPAFAGRRQIRGKTPEKGEFKPLSTKL
jgi:hypothetical protein